jgi:threonine dehydrogenase-like Zn-dependent dehydrogenase
MRGAVLYAPGDIRVEQRDDPKIAAPTDAIIRISAACVCGSDLWHYRGIEPIQSPIPMGHEYVGVVEETGSDVRSIKAGEFVVGSFMASDNTCPICQAGYQSRCVHVEYVGAGGAQAEYLRVPLADGTLVATPGQPDEDLIPGLVTASDVLGTGWFGGRRRGWTRQDGRGRRRWRGRPARGPRGQAAGCRADHRDEPA